MIILKERIGQLKKIKGFFNFPKYKFIYENHKVKYILVMKCNGVEKDCETNKNKIKNPNLIYQVRHLQYQDKWRR